MSDTTQNAKTSHASKIPDDLRDKLIEQAVAVARESGRSTDGLAISVSEWTDSWKVWFTPRSRGQGGGSGFVVEIYKDGKKPPRILKGQ